MRRLGYPRWAAQGGDWGAVVTTALGAMRPEGLLGIHLNTQYAFPAQVPDTLSAEQHHAVETLALYTGDLTCGEPGWEAVADFALDWAPAPVAGELVP